MAFQTSIQVTQAPFLAGDFTSVNPRHSALSVPGGFVAGPNGLTVGLFAWADTATGTILSNTGLGAPLCFIHRENQAMLNMYLQEFGMTVPAGMGVGSMFSAGDFGAKNAGSGACTRGMKAFANNTNGTVSFAAAGATVTGSTETKYFCWTNNAAGEMVKISSTSLG